MIPKLARWTKPTATALGVLYSDGVLDREELTLPNLQGMWPSGMCTGLKPKERPSKFSGLAVLSHLTPVVTDLHLCYKIKYFSHRMLQKMR